MNLKLVCSCCQHRFPTLNINGAAMCVACAHAEINRAAPRRFNVAEHFDRMRAAAAEGRLAQERWDRMPHGRAFIDALVAGTLTKE